MRPLLIAALSLLPLVGADLVSEFRNPPPEARPRVYWLWLHSSVAKDRITFDLEQMHAKGIGGMIQWDPGPGPSRYGTRATDLPPSPLWMSQPWRDALHHALNEAGRLNLDFTLFLSPGPNCGGPWITPALSAQRLVFSSVAVTGPTRFSATLPLPDGLAKDANGQPLHYRDIAVFAAEPYRVGHTRTTQEISQIFPVADLDHIEFGSPWIDLTSRLTSDGRLTWDVPPGMYRILRLGHTTTGQNADYFRPEGAGRLADHMNPTAVEFSFQTMLNELFPGQSPVSQGGHSVTVPPRRPFPPALKAIHCDSYEVYGSDWTPNLLDEFRRRRGYDPTPYLPTLEGGNVNSRALTARFRADLERTRSDLFADYHYQRLLDLAHANGLQFQAESGGPRVISIDTLKMLGRNDVPMGEFWARAKTHRVTEEERFLVKEISSAAHIYGKRWAAVEAFTSVGPHWEEDPWSLKPDADRAFLEGANRFFLHTFTHSPDSFGKPGIEYFAGTHFNPNITWWDQAKAWTDYLARCSQLLSVGLPVADVLYYYGEQIPAYVPPLHIDPALGRGYDYDVTNAEVLLTRAAVKNGRITLPDGMSYAALVLPNQKAMSLEVLRKIGQLAAAGATVIGPPPSEAPGLSGYPESDRAVQSEAQALWSQGRILNGPTIRELLTRKSIAPDFEAPEGLETIHRRTSEADIYFVVNRTDHPIAAEAAFRVTGKAPEIFFPDTGATRPQLVYRETKGRTAVPLKLAARESIFVVFRNPTGPHSVTVTGNAELIAPNRLRAAAPGPVTVTNEQGRQAQLNIPASPTLEVTGAWTVKFAPNWGAPESALFPALVSWTDRPEEGIRHFSGAAAYSLDFQAPAALFSKDLHLELDLGQVANLAELSLNGQALGVLWKPPFRVPVTGILKPGRNHIEVKVVNLWTNRLIGDESLPEAQRYTRTNMRPYTAAAPLRTSGLLGPVRVLASRELTLDFLTPSAPTAPGTGRH
ncbi:MAG: hypothetical protein HY821_01590 [Acidobacteria bacterium]|nr:hypothetical protein [Acidobacteriota bacterium]